MNDPFVECGGFVGRLKETVLSGLDEAGDTGDLVRDGEMGEVVLIWVWLEKTKDDGTSELDITSSECHIASYVHSQ